MPIRAFEINSTALISFPIRGLYFESTIPQGFGIGSSGALCAAIYDRYSKNPVPNDRHINSKQILKLRQLFY